MAITMNPLKLVTSGRFDILPKYVYAKFRDRNLQTSFGLDIYLEHLRVWNNFGQDGLSWDGKTGPETYLSSFNLLLDSLKHYRFDSNKSRVVINENKNLLHGSHRTAGCIFYNRPIGCEIGNEGACDFDYNFFKNKTIHVAEGLSQDFSDYIAYEYCKLKYNTFIVTIFPTAVGNTELVENILKSNGDIFYKKSVHLNNNGAFNLIKQMYNGESWGGNEFDNFSGFRNKTNLCFKHSGPAIVYVVNFNSDNLQDIESVKSEIRNIFNEGKHSVHINDTKEETIRLARCLLNQNSVHFMNNSKESNYSNFKEQLNYFKNYINNNNLNIEDYCITGSSILSMYGLREGADLDYLHNGDEIVGHNMIHSHNEYSEGRYSTSIDDIIYNPKNHFYYDDVKVATLGIIDYVKSNRKEEKDIRDIELIRSVS